MFHLQLVKNKQQKEQDSLDNDYVSVVESDFPLPFSDLFSDYSDPFFLLI